MSGDTTAADQTPTATRTAPEGLLVADNLVAG